MQKHHSIFDKPLEISEYNKKLYKIKEDCKNGLLSLNLSAKVRAILKDTPFPDEVYLNLIKDIVEKNIDSNKGKIASLYFSESPSGKSYREYVQREGLIYIY